MEKGPSSNAEESKIPDQGEISRMLDFFQAERMSEETIVEYLYRQHPEFANCALAELEKRITALNSDDALDEIMIEKLESLREAIMRDDLGRMGRRRGTYYDDF